MNYQRIKHIVRTLIFLLMGCYFGAIALLNLPFVQRKLSALAASELRHLLQSEVSIERIDLGMPGRIIIQGVRLKDQERNDLLQVSRLAAKFDLSPLLHRQIRISSIQLFGLKAHLLRKDSLTAPNYQFLLDAFASKDTVRKAPPVIDLRVNTLLVRRGQLSYQLLSAPVTPDRFNPQRMDISNLSATLSLKALNADSLNAYIRRLSFQEASGLQLKRLSARLRANHRQLLADNVQIELPQSTFRLDTLLARYDSLPALTALAEHTTYSGRLHADITPSDFQALVPSLQHFQDAVRLQFAFHGQGTDTELDYLLLDNDPASLRLQAKGRLLRWNDPERRWLSAHIQEAEVTPEGIGWLTHNLTGKASIPPLLLSNEYVRVGGELSGHPERLTLQGHVSTAAGRVNTHVTLHTDQESGRRTYSGRIATDGLDVGVLTGDRKVWGKTTFDLQLNALRYENGQAESYVKGDIGSIEYKGYHYQHIRLDGQYGQGGFNGRLALDDPNGSVILDGRFVPQGPVPLYQLTASLQDVRPHALHLTPRYEDTRFSLRLKADFSGNSIDNLRGQLQIDSLDVAAADSAKCYFLPQLVVQADRHEDGRQAMSVRSPFLNAELEGHYSYKTLPASVTQLLQRYLPSLVNQPPRHEATDNRFRFRLRMTDSDLLSKVLDIPLDLHLPLELSGRFDDLTRSLQLAGHFPELVYGGTYYESGSLLCQTDSLRLRCLLHANKRQGKGAMLSLSLRTQAADDRLETVLDWGNNTGHSYYGRVSALTRFAHDENNRSLQTHIELQPSRIILNDTVWNMHPATLSIADGRVEIRDFHFEHGDKFVRANGSIGKAETDSCLVDLQNIDLQYVIDMVHFKAVKFSGLATGRVHLHHVLNDPVMYTRLDVKDFSLNDGLLGRGDIRGQWDKEVGGIRLTADIRDGEHSRTRVKGYVSPQQDGLDLDIQAQETNLYFLTPFIDGIFSDLSGRGTGRIRLYGPFSDLDLEGDLRASAEVKVNILNTRFRAEGDSVRLRSGSIRFKDIQLTDAEGHTGTANGTLTHTKLKNLMYNFRFRSEGMQVFRYDRETPDFPFYGRVYATGDLILRGGGNQLHIDGALTSNEKTTFTYVTTTAAAATSTQFITFVDKTPRRQADDIDENLYHHMNQQEKDDDDDGPETDIFINLLVEATPAATVKIIMDPVAGDHITATGSGSLQANYYNKGDFQMFGNYNVAKGIYKMSMQNFIRKDFTLQPGGIVSFNGDPLNANVNVQAIYTVNSASLNDLVADASSSKGSVRVNCLVNMTGSLQDPELKFDLELPTVSEEDRELVRSVTNTEEQMNTQIIYLLSVGKFYTYDYANSSNQSDATSSLAFNTLSGQLNNMLSQVINNQNWNFGTNLTTGAKGWSDVEAEAILSGSLLNNRLIINGNFGYRDNPMRNTNFVGDFEALWLLTKNGDLRLKGYNQTNDRYFTKSTLTTQGIGLLYQKDFNHWRELVDWLLLHKRRKKNPTD